MKLGMNNFILYLILLMTAGFGWLIGSPRWSYATTGFLVLFTWYRMNFEMPAINFRGLHIPATGQFWGWRTFVTLGMFFPSLYTFLRIKILK